MHQHIKNAPGKLKNILLEHSFLQDSHPQKGDKTLKTKTQEGLTLEHAHVPSLA